MYSICLCTGIVTRDSDGIQVAPCQSSDDADFIEYNTWVNAGNAPTETIIVADASDKIRESIKRAMEFGQTMSLDFLTENTLLGITKAGMVERVREILDTPFRAVETGSLNEAINRLKAITEDQKDPVFVSNERLIKYINKIETYLGRTLTATL